MDNPWADEDEPRWGSVWPARSHSPDLVAESPSAPVSDPSHPSVRPPSSDSNFDPVPETNDANDIPISQNVKSSPDDLWTAWDTPSPSNADPKQTQHPDQWEAARQQKEKLNRAVPPELLDPILRHCQTVLQETWPSSPSNDEGNWRSGFDGHADISALLAQLIPVDAALPPAVQFSATATAKAMNEALKLTRRSPASASSPLSRLLASKGSLEWEKSIKAKQVVVPDTTHVGWRVLEKEDRVSTLAEESKTKKATGGLLSFWSRKTSALQVAPVETPKERSSSPAGTSLESAKSAIHPPSSRAASPSKVATSPVPPAPADPQPAVLATVLAPSAISRFLNRFSLAKGPQHCSLALSSDDLEFLSDIVPSASDPPDEDINDRALDALAGASHSSPLPTKLPPPVLAPPEQPSASSRPSSALGLGTVAGTSVAFNAPNVPLLPPPLSPQPAAPLSRPQSPPLSLKDAATVVVAFGQSNILLSQPRSFTLPPQKPHPSLSIPPLLPPPPISPPQTPRPPTLPLSSTTRSADTSSFRDSYDSDDEFSAFASFPPSSPVAPFPSSEPYPSQGPPSPPPRRTYERTHHISSSSTSSILSPASQTSLDRLYSSKSTVSASLDSFDGFISPPQGGRSESKKRAPSPPPLPIKPPSPTLRVDTVTSRVYHAHTPSQTSFSPTVHTSLMHSAFSVPSEQHKRTQSLVDHAASRRGMVWPNTSDADESSARTIPPPASASASPKPFVGEEGLDLLGDDDVLGGGFGALPAPLSAFGGFMVSPLAADASRMPFGVGGGLGKGLGLRSQLQPSPPPLPSASAPIPSFSPSGKPVLLAAASTGPLQPAKPKQPGGLSAQDLSFFEGV